MPCERGGVVCAVALATGLLIFIKRVRMDVDYPAQQQLQAPSNGNLLLINDGFDPIDPDTFSRLGF